MFLKYEQFKNIVDVLFAILVLIILFPVLFIIALLLMITQQGEFLFFQTRIGHKEKRFKIIKFKTMNNKINSKGKLAHDNERLTIFGKLLRSLSLDELPSLLNIVKGDMSFVGPRPLLEDYLKYYTSEESKRHNVKPGLTGWAQINGRNQISWEKKFSFDIWYVRNQSFILDIVILFKTFWKVLKRNGINNSKNITMPYFKR